MFVYMLNIVKFSGLRICQASKHQKSTFFSAFDEELTELSIFSKNGIEK